MSQQGPRVGPERGSCGQSQEYRERSENRTGSFLQMASSWPPGGAAAQTVGAGVRGLEAPCWARLCVLSLLYLISFDLMSGHCLPR